MAADGKFLIDKESPIPLYYQVKQFLVSKIKAKEYSPGDAIPTESELCEMFGVSRPTVRQALSELVHDGHLVRMKGKGTFVAYPKIDARFFKNLQSFNKEMREKGMEPSTRVICIEMRTDETAAQILGLPAASPLIYLERLRYADDMPMVYLETYLPYERFSALYEVDFSVNSLYESLDRLYGLPIYKVRRNFEAVLPTTKEAGLLGIKKTQPICFVTTIATTDQNEDVEYSLARYRGDMNKFSIELYREP